MREGVLRAPMALDYAQPWVDPRDIGESPPPGCCLRAGRVVRSRPSTAPKTSRLPRSPRSSARPPAAGSGPRRSRKTPCAPRCDRRGLGDKQVEGMAGMSAVMREDFVAEDKRSIVTTTPTTLAAWAHACLRPALLARQG